MRLPDGNRTGGRLLCSPTAHDQNVLGRCAQEKPTIPSCTGEEGGETMTGKRRW